MVCLFNNYCETRRKWEEEGKIGKKEERGELGREERRRLVSPGILERFASFYPGNGRRGGMSQLFPNLFYETSFPLILNPNRESETKNNPR